jgi:hypothetical protein
MRWLLEYHSSQTIERFQNWSGCFDPIKEWRKMMPSSMYFRVKVSKKHRRWLQRSGAKQKNEDWVILNNSRSLKSKSFKQAWICFEMGSWITSKLRLVTKSNGGIHQENSNWRSSFRRYFKNHVIPTFVTKYFNRKRKRFKRYFELNLNRSLRSKLF